MTKPILLQDAFKTFTADQDKIVPPEETVRRFREKLQHLDLQILEEVRRIDNGRLGIPVYFSVCGRDARAVTGTTKQMGKGATPSQAQASAVMELAERFSFFSFLKTPTNFIVDTFENLRHRALPFDVIAQSVHDRTTDLEAAERVFAMIPMRWAQAFSLTRGQSVLLPFDWFYAINEFNGPSAGNCVEEALSQGICEVVERHVSSLISRRQLSVPAIRLASAADPLVREMLATYDRHGIQLHVQDFTLDTGIPTVGVLAYDPTTFPTRSEIVWTAGTTPCPEKAFSRALTEVAQLAGDFNSGANYVASGLPKFTRLEQTDYLRQPGSVVDLQQLPDLSDDNIRVEVENLVAALDRCGLDVMVIDTMHPRLQIPAFYTVIPGAHFRERAEGTNVGMFAAKLILQNHPPVAALEQLERIEALLPGRYYVKFYQALCRINMDRPEQALALLEQALELAPTPEDTASIYSYMGVCLKDAGRYREALAVLERGLAIDQERTDLHNLKGFCHFKLKEHEAAIASFEAVTRLDPSSAIDYANIASNYRDLGQRAKAIEYYRTALAIDPTIEFARDNLTRLTDTEPGG
jgi:ribosomal protein S12 methylthiotransferase accessory factor